MVMVLKAVLFLLAIARVEGLRKLWKLNDFSKTERTTKTLLELCYEKDDGPNPIVIFGDFNEFIDGSSIIRMKNFLNPIEDNGRSGLFNFKGNKIILTKDSLEKLQSALTLLKKSQWWNHQALFFIIGKNEETCENFKDVLTTTWKMDIINSIYICSDSKKALALYTLNPFANYAPYPWKRVDELNDLNVFFQVFNPHHSCENLHYDKTKVLNGHEIRAMQKGSVNEIYTGETNNFTEHVSFFHFHRVFHSLIKTLNASYVLEINTNQTEIFEHLKSRTSDMMLNFVPVYSSPEIAFLFPYYQTGIVAVVRVNHEISTFQKILHLWSRPVLIAAAIALTIFTLILTIIDHDFMSAILDTIRLLIYGSILFNNSRHSFRLYFTTMLVFMIISNGVFQGKIAAFLTTREKIPALETTDEAIKAGYKFYVLPEYQEIIEKIVPKLNIKPLQREKCKDYLKYNTHSSCILPERVYEEDFILLPVDRIKKPLTTLFMNQKCRNNWPLRERIDGIWMRTVEAGLFDFWRMEKAAVQKDKRKANDAELASEQYRPVRLDKLDFIFQLLLIGLAIATIVFVMEVLVAEYRATQESLVNSRAV